MPPETHTPHAARPPAGPDHEDREEATGLPWFHTWRRLYCLVLVCFVLDVILLAVFSRAFS